MNAKTDRETLVMSMGMETGIKCVCREELTGKIENAITKLKCGKPAGVDAIIPEMMKYGGAENIK